MSLRTLSASAAAAVLLVLVTGCSPDNEGSTPSDKASTGKVSSQETSSNPQDDSTSKPSDGSTVKYPADYICKQVTAKEVGSTFDANVTTTPSQQLEGRALCTYTVTEPTIYMLSTICFSIPIKNSRGHISNPSQR